MPSSTRTRSKWTAEMLNALRAGWSTQKMQSVWPFLTASSINSQRYLERKAGRMVAETQADDEPLIELPRMERTDKKIGSFNWREANQHIAGMQEMRSRASFSQSASLFRVETDQPICVLALSDTHIADWATDHTLLETITDEILSTPNLFVFLLGDLAQMAIKLRSVSEVSSNMLPPELQAAYIESWLEEIAPRVLACSWDNHAVEREQSQSGISMFKHLQSRRFVYFDGIGHPDVHVGNETYKFAVSHRFAGRSIENPCHAPMRYLRREAHDREIALMGDYHVPGIMKFTHGATTKVAINTGSFQTNSGYAKRYYSLFTHPVMPCVVLYPDRHEMVPLWGVDEYRRLIGLNHKTAA